MTGSHGTPRISRREADVLAALGERLTNAEIAAKLFISVRTVESHVSSLLRKFAVADRLALAGVARARTSATAALPGLPVPRTSFIGRAHERDALLTALDTARLVTLVGPGGVGKTRLAIEVSGAIHIHGGFVDLVPVRPGYVVQAVATRLGLREGPERPLLDAVVEHLGHRPALLVLDNCEHLVDTVAGFVDRVLAACPGTTVLATSRQRLGLPGERSVTVGPLALASDAERLFRERAAAVDPELVAEPAAVADICARLDGIPLAIELAAARTASLGVDTLRAALTDSLRVLDGGRGHDQRHHSLRAVLDWSHDLLHPAERDMFRRLSVFRGGFDLAAATAVAVPADAPPAGAAASVADVLGRLADRSLMVRYGGATSRWRMLETIRAYAAAKLAASGDEAAVRRGYLRWAARTATALADRVALSGDAWTDEFDGVADDLRSALATAPAGPDEVAHRLARALGELTYARRFLRESVTHFRRAADHAPAATAAADLLVASDAVYTVDRASVAFDLLLQAAERAREAGDRRGEAVTLARAVVTVHRFSAGFTRPVPPDRVRQLLGDARAAAGGGGDARAAADGGDALVAAHLAAAEAWSAGVTPTGAALAERAVAMADAVGDEVLVSGALDLAGTLAARAGRLREAHRIARQRLDLLPLMPRHRPECAAEVLDICHVAWLCAFAAGDLPAALDTAETIAADEVLGAHPYRAASKLVPTLVMVGRFDEALDHARGMWHAWEAAGCPTAAWMAPAASAAALAHGLRHDPEGHRQWRARAVRATGVTNPALARGNDSFASFVDVRVAAHAGRFTDAAALVERASADFPPGRHETYARAAAAELAVLAGLPDADDRLADAAAAGDENEWAAACLARARGRRHGDRDSLVAAARGFARVGARFERAVTLLLLPDQAAQGRVELEDLSVPGPVG
ncbi:ATP-binding protein [Micromonospora costi]|uniref:ATP-binding protein n=1 Tax=Micromonospora costi TaxID=1530042 RepID=UPI001319ED5D|nr:LuxR C-terminal-related transcriptional regulator [Micromonospora costi]